VEPHVCWDKIVLACKNPNPLQSINLTSNSLLIWNGDLGYIWWAFYYCSVTIGNEEQWESIKKNCTILDAHRSKRRLICQWQCRGYVYLILFSIPLWLWTPSQVLLIQ
jgi:hypothetical protein